jgi:hypothetical protein
MQNPFSSDYVSATVTGPSPVETVAKEVTSCTSVAVPPPINEAVVTAYGFEPERYGLGKPRRIVIRGKIAIE